MASNDSAPAATGITLISLGATSTAIGGLGVGFRAAGLGYLGQSLLALVVGVFMLSIGLRLAASARRAVFRPARVTPVRVRAVYSTEPTPARVRVPAWTSPQLALPPARHR